MFKQALRNHNAVKTSPKPVASQQQSLNGAFKPPAVQHGTRPLSTGTGNDSRPTNARRRTSPNSHGIKRTSAGLAKALSSQGDAFDYPNLPLMANDWPDSRHLQGALVHSTPVFFDENDFDSDLDLDVEDPATKATIQYPSLPKAQTRDPNNNKFDIQLGNKPSAGRLRRDSSNNADSAYGSIPPTRQNTETRSPKSPALHNDSSQPIPWSSSPLDHLQPLKKPSITQFAYVEEPVKKTESMQSKRRTLPWLKNKVHEEVISEPEIEDEHEEEAPQRKKRAKSDKITGKSTPLPKNGSKDAYPWNTTASAIKEQQKNLRQANKTSQLKLNDATEEGKKEAAAKRKGTKFHRIFLSEEQQHVLNLVVEQKKSVFFTGSAGTGKSVLLREIISAMRRKFIREPDRVAVTASTGLSACNIGGVTLHSFAGIGLGKEPTEELVKKIRRNQKAKQRWLRTKVLIIDEVSMVDGELFDKLEQIARTLRNNGRPFGGIQLIITGDFFQLPPVPEQGRVARFAFDAGTWTTAIEHTIGLHHVFRQKDPEFANMLNEMREGRMSSASIASFRKLDRPLADAEGIEATELFPTRMEVDRANTMRMAQLHGDTFSFESRDGGTIVDKTMRDKLLSNCIAPEVVHLKKGAQVMLIKNMDETLVNGSLGKVRGFMTDSMWEEYKKDEEAFLENPGDGPSATAVQAAKKAAVLGINTQQVYPVVRFAVADGSTRDLLCKRESWKIELPNGEVQASREQIPLILAWALSIHKAQGQTLERVRVDLGKVFEKGQAYVALSRATSMAGLQVLRFDPKKVVAHEKVRGFYNSLSRAEQAGAATKEKKSEKGSIKAYAYEQSYVGSKGAHA